MCASNIRKIYNGDSLALYSLVDKVTLLKDLTNPSLNLTFLNFVKSKLEARAREALPDNFTSVDQIRTVLRQEIKSKVILGKMAILVLGTIFIRNFHGMLMS